MTSVATVPFEIFKGQDFYVPAFKIVVRDQELRLPVHDVITVAYSDSISEIDSFDLTVSNWDPGEAGGKGQFKYSDGDMFMPWQDVELWMGYFVDGVDQRERLLMGEIVTMMPNFPENGGSTLAVRGLNLLHRFRISQQTDTFLKKKDSEIARTLIQNIASEVKKSIPRLRLQTDEDELTQNLKDEEPIPTLEMKNEYPINFLYTRAKRIGYELTLEEEPSASSERVVTVHYRRPDAVKRPTYILEWGKTLLSFQPSFETARQVDKVTVRGWDPYTKQPLEETVTRQDLLSEGILDPQQNLNVKKRQAPDRVEIVTDEIVQTQAEARLVARRRMRQIAQGTVLGKGKTIGLPGIRSGGKLQIAGLGRFSGLYQITTATHTLGDSGYTTDFSARMETAK